MAEHDEDGFSHHCPKCNHHNPTLCVVAGQVKGLKAAVQVMRVERDEALAKARHWKDCHEARWQELAGIVSQMPTESPYEAARRVVSERDRLRDGIKRASRGKCSRPGCDNSVPMQPPWCSVACMDEHVKSLPPSTPEKPWTCSACGYMNTACICTKCGAHKTP